MLFLKDMAKLTLDLLQQEIDYVMANNEFLDAFESYNLVKDWLDRSGILKNSPEYTQYENYLMKFKFIGFNYLKDTEERADLLKNYFSLSLEIDQFDLWRKLETELVAISDLNERDIFKTKMREALEKCDNVLISRQKYVNQEIPRKVDEWIKSFIANLGLDKFDKVKKVEYFSNNQFIKILDAKDKDRVKILLDIYEKLKISSKTPEGYDNSVVMNIDDKTIIFNHGNIEEIASVDKIRHIDIGTLEPGLANKQFDLNPSISHPIITTSQPAQETRPFPTLTELENILKNYPESSLEHKAISQEISRFKRSELKKSQKVDVKK